MSACEVYDLRCEYRDRPLGLGERRPRLSWKIRAQERGVAQTAYQVQTAFDEAFAAVLWDSGKVDSGRSAHIEYNGPALQSRTRCWYRVRVWDGSGGATAWSDAAYWETGLLEAAEWKASWIKSPTPTDAEAADYMRREFQADGRVIGARIYATALGLYRLYVNGSPADDTLFAPGWTSYNKRLQVQTYDVTELLNEGGNCLAVMLANGWYKGNLGWKNDKDLYGSDRALLLQLHLVYEDGRETTIVSDEQWQCGTGGLRMSELYHGEMFDARLEPEGWKLPGFDAGGWQPAQTFERPREALTAQEGEPVRIVERLKPHAVLTTPRGESVIDLGQNMVGWFRFAVRGAEGQSITLRHAEVLDKDGNFYTGNLRSARQTATYICKGGMETFEPFFSFQGFRYVQVEGASAAELADGGEGCVIHTDMEPTGRFRCSDELLNRLQRNIVWGQRGNFLDVPTDCPQRDERLGWTGDAQVFVRTAAFNYGVAPFFTKWLRDLAADQQPDGAVPHVVPDVPLAGYGSAAWGDAATICPWTIYLCYGDTRILETQFRSMKAWVDYIRAQGDDELLWNTGFHFGDWLALDAKENSYIGATPKDLIATAFYARSAELVAKAAAVLGRAADAAAYRDLRERIAQAFRREFVTPNGRVASPTQTAYTLALMFDLLDEKDRPRAARMLVERIEENGVHLTTGFVGTPYLCRVLTRFGYHELAGKLALQREYPSWLYAVLRGATTIWEHWDGIKPDGSFWSDDMNSFNHYAYGSIGEWLYHDVAGLEADESEPGYRRIVVKPGPWEGLTEAEAVLQTMYGDVRVAWQRDGSRMTVDVELPPNTTADITLPGAGEPGDVRESGAPLSGPVAGLGAASRSADGVRLEAGSGAYSFSYTLGPG